MLGIVNGRDNGRMSRIIWLYTIYIERERRAPVIIMDKATA